MKNDGIVLGVIPARGQSRRVPRKNLKLLQNKPLIAWSIEEAKKAKSLDYFLVSTNDEEITKISKNYGAKVPFKRPERISIDCDTSIVLNHAMQWYERHYSQKVGWVCCLQPTSPLRQSDDIDRCVQIAKSTDADTVISISQARQSPFWCFELLPSQQLRPFMDTPLEGNNLVWQNLPILFYPNGAVYVTRRDMILQNRIYGDKIYGYMMPTERSLDLEEEQDFIYASALLQTYGKDGHVFKQNSWIVS